MDCDCSCCSLDNIRFWCDRCCCYSHSLWCRRCRHPLASTPLLIKTVHFCAHTQNIEGVHVSVLCMVVLGRIRARNGVCKSVRANEMHCVGRSLIQWRIFVWFRISCFLYLALFRRIFVIFEWIHWKLSKWGLWRIIVALRYGCISIIFPRITIVWHPEPFYSIQHTRGQRTNSLIGHSYYLAYILIFIWISRSFLT